MGMDYVEIVMNLEERFGLDEESFEHDLPRTVGALFDCVWREVSRREQGMPESQKSREEDVWFEVCRIILKSCGNTMDVKLVSREMRLIEDLGVE